MPPAVGRNADLLLSSGGLIALNVPSGQLTGEMLLVSCGQRPFSELAIQ
jgi:hypothetical protein